MTDIELLVREALGRHGAEVPIPDVVEVRPVAVRARRRQVVNAMGAGLVALVIALGAVSGVGVLLRADARKPAGESTGTPTIDPTPVPGEIVAPGRVGLPPAGADPSVPEEGDAIITVSAEEKSPTHVQTEIVIFADGRMIWRRVRCETPGYDECALLVRSDVAGEALTGWFEQRLTPDTISMLRRELLATGFFERDHWIDKPFDQLIDWFTVGVAVDGRIVTVSTNSNYLIEPLSSKQTSALARMEELVADPGATLPDSAFVDRELRPFVPARYNVAFLWEKPTAADLAELPAPADALVTDGCSFVTTGQASSIVDALDRARIPRLSSDRSLVGYAWRGDQRRQELWLVPVLPDGTARC